MAYGQVEEFNKQTRLGKISCFDYKDLLTFWSPVEDFEQGECIEFKPTVGASNVRKVANPSPISSVYDGPSDAAKAASGRFDCAYSGQYGNSDAIEAQQKNDPPAKIDCGTFGEDLSKSPRSLKDYQD